MSNLLSEFASGGLAESLAPFVAIAHAHHLKLRNDEMNSVSCGTANGVANVFGSALWSLDALFQMARVGVDGVNIHTAPTYPDRLFVAKKVHHVRRAAGSSPSTTDWMMLLRRAPAGFAPRAGVRSERRPQGLGDARHGRGDSRGPDQ